MVTSREPVAAGPTAAEAEVSADRASTLAGLYGAFASKYPRTMILVTCALAMMAALAMLLAGHPEAILYQGF